MDGSIAVVKNLDDGSNLSQRALESPVRIDRISVDLVNTNNPMSDAEKCEHFSIRGFVSEIRKKDWKKCWPFDFDYDDNFDDKTSLLPTLHVPQFKLWCCHSCLTEDGEQNSTKNCGPIVQACDAGLKANSFISNGRHLGDSDMLLSDFQHPPELVTDCGQKVEANGSDNLNNTTEVCPSSFIDKKEKRSANSTHPIVGKSVLPKDVLNRIRLKQTCAKTKISSSSVGKLQRADGRVSLKLKGKGCAHLQKAGSAQLKGVATEFARNLNCRTKCVAKTFESEACPSTSGQRKEVKVCRPPGKVGDLSAENACKIGVFPPPEKNLCHHASSESDEVMGGNDLHIPHHDNLNGMHRKKTRKVRLLTELLCVNDKKNTRSIRADHFDPNMIDNPSPGVVEDEVFQDEVANNGNIRQASAQKGKRKLCIDEDLISAEESSPTDVCTEVMNTNKDAQHNHEVVDSELKEDSGTRMANQTDTNNQLTPYKTGKSPILGKNENSKILNFKEFLPMTPAEDNVPNANTSDASEGNATANDLFKSVRSSITGREMNSFPVPAQSTELQAGFFGKQSKIAHVDRAQPSPITWTYDMFRAGPNTVKDVENTMHSKPLNVSFQTGGDESIGKELCLSFNSYITSQKNCMNSTARIKPGQISSSTWSENIPIADETMTRTSQCNHIACYNVNSKSAKDAPLENKVDSNLFHKRPGCTTPSLNAKSKTTCQVDMGNSSLKKKKDFHGTNKSDITTGIHKDFLLSRRDYDRRAQNVPEVGVLDDVPMEIVELMAKNQYERCLPDAEYDRCQMDMSKNCRNGYTLDLNKECGQEDLSLFKLQPTQKQKLQGKIKRNGVMKKGERLGATKQKLALNFSQPDTNQYNVSQLEDTQVTARSGGIHQSQEMLLSGLQYSAACLSRQTATPSWNWTARVSEKIPYNTSFQVSGPSNEGLSILQQSKEANHPWSSMIPNQLASPYGIPQKSAGPSNTLNMCSHSSGNVYKDKHFGNHYPKIPNPDISEIRKQSKVYGPETTSRTHQGCQCQYNCKHNRIELNQKPMGSLNVFPNEAIPAMHLLSLMDARIQSSTPPNNSDSGRFDVPHTTKLLPCNYQGKNQLLENNYPCIPTISKTTGASSSSFDKAKFPGDLSKKKGKKVVSKAGEKSKGCRSQVASTSVISGMNCGSVPACGMQMMLQGASNSMILPAPVRAVENSTGINLDAPSGSKAVYLNKQLVETGICSVNRNPADFSIPEIGNVYMIAGEELRLSRNVAPLNRSKVSKAEGIKRQKKLPVKNDNGHHRTS